MNVHIQRIIHTFKASIRYDELLSGAQVGITVDVSLHDDNMIDDNKSTRDEMTTANEHLKKTANEHLNEFTKATNSTIDDNTTANEHLNGFHNANKSTIDVNTTANEHLNDANEHLNEFTKANNSTTDDHTTANEQLSELNKGNASTIDENTTANEQLNEPNNANKSTTDDNTTANEHSNGFDTVNNSTIDDNTIDNVHLNQIDTALDRMDNGITSSNEPVRAFFDKRELLDVNSVAATEHFIECYHTVNRDARPTMSPNESPTVNQFAVSPNESPTVNRDARPTMSPNESPIVTEIESTKRRIQAEIDDVTERTNLRVDALITNAIMNREDIAITQQSLDIYNGDAIQRTQIAMDAELLRLMHLSHLMQTLFHGIDSVTSNIHNESTTTQLIVKENQTIALESISLTPATASPKTTNESLRAANDRSTPNESQTVAKKTMHFWDDPHAY